MIYKLFEMSIRSVAIWRAEDEEHRIIEWLGKDGKWYPYVDHQLNYFNSKRFALSVLRNTLGRKAKKYKGPQKYLESYK